MSAPPRCYTVADVCGLLKVSRRTFFYQRQHGKLPFLEELRPRIGRPRYRADLVDRYLAGQWIGPRPMRRSA
ncbi:MAG TPA: helix-turn-helix domain-containing protein [Vicinamibacterales bacterium]|nr:helix-turn-helix domain-containing protein [Vicinamibacterales bacterium]